MRARAPLAALLAAGFAAVALAAAPDAMAARKKPRHKPNMPDGWVWPPSRVMKREGKRCLRELDEMGVVWKRAPKTRKVVTPILVPSMELGGVKLVSIFRKGPFVMDCHLATSLARAGEVMQQIGVRELHFSTIHEFRRIRVRKRKGGRPLSRHALGMAIDVFKIVIDTGETVVVEKDYRKEEPTLLALERGMAASLDFRTPLTPGNARRSHRDHFHLEAQVRYDEQPQARRRAARSNVAALVVRRR